MSDKEVVTQPAPQIGISLDQLRELIQTIKNPGKSDIEIADQQEIRRANVENVKREREQKELQQKYCTHRNRLMTRFVHVYGNNLGDHDFFICQACQKIVNRFNDPQMFNSLIANQGMEN